MNSIAQFHVPENPMPLPPRDPRDHAVLYQHPSAPVIYAVPTPESIAYAKAEAEKEIIKAHAAMDAVQRCRDAGVPRQLLDLCLVDGLEQTGDWFQVCVLELGGRR